MRARGVDYLFKLLILFAIYFITARLGLNLGAVSGFATTVWPPTGIALAALYVLGYRYWPAIAAGAFFVNFMTGATLAVALGISLGNTLEALIGVYLLKQIFKVDTSLERVNDVLGLVLGAAIVSTLISATIGVSSLLLGGVITTSVYMETWVAWWIGDMLGALVIAPLLLVWHAQRREKLGRKQDIKTLTPFALLAVVSYMVFFGLSGLSVQPFSLAYAVYPLLLWIALRFNQPGSVSGVFLVSVIAIWGTVATYDLSADYPLSHSLLLLQGFIGITSVTFMIMAAVVSERQETFRQRLQLINRAASLSKQRAKLKALNEAMDEFISIASHQLRTPATSVKQYIGMMLYSYAGKLTDEQRVYAQIAYASNEQQIKIIDSLLVVAKLDAGKLKPNKRNCNLAKLMTEIVKYQDPEFKNRKQKVIMRSSKKGVSAAVDKELLRMALNNVLDNAGKYSPAETDIEIGVERVDNFIKIEISDHGIGIADDDKQRLFKKFSRGSNSNRHLTYGSGLGLYWAKKIVDLHSGKIKLTSALNKGSTFSITIPAG